MKRRQFIGLLATAAWPLAANAETTKVYRVGTLTPGPQSLLRQIVARFSSRGWQSVAICLDKT